MKIKEEALLFALGVSRRFHPDEFGGMLRGKGDVIEEVLVIPATEYSADHVTTRMDMVPPDKTIIGSMHSHPSYDFLPSKADLAFFRKTGYVHLIARHPFKGVEDVAAYDKAGRRIRLAVV